MTSIVGRGLESERATFARWCRENGHGELDDMLTPLDRSLRDLMWAAWQGAAESTRENCAETIEVLVCECCHKESEVEFARYLAGEIRGA